MSRQAETPTPPAGDETRVENTTQTSIPDNNTTGITSRIDVAATGRASSVRVAVNITHTFIGDLRIDLKHGDKTVRIYSGAGGSQDNLAQEFALPDFQGAEVGGQWELVVSDQAAQDVGTLDRWAVVYTPDAGGTTPTPTRRDVTGSSSTRVDIPDNNATGVTSRIAISDTGTVRNLVLTVDIQHPYIGDLKVQLRHGGTSIVVHKKGTGGSADNIVREYTLGDFNGTNVTGNWELVLSDQASRDVGYLQSWSLRATVE
jgi:subtilisin-like proprotein convertase family protein